MNSMRNSIFLVLVFVVLMLTNACNGIKINKKELNDNNVSTINYVPDKATAIKIAEAVWLPIYGEKIYSQKPYMVSLKDDSIWIVIGTLAENKRGGVAYIEIQKKDCKILKVTHGK